MEIYLVRHGESIGNTKRGFLSGKTDPKGLSKKGKVEAVRLGFVFQSYIIDRIITSPVQRAYETAQIIQYIISRKDNRIAIVRDDSFTELDHGIFENKYFWQVKDKIPKNWHSLFQEDYTTPYPEGESFRNLVVRSWKGFQHLVNALGKNEKIAVVSHQAVIASIMYCIAHHGLPKNGSSFMRFLHNTKLPNACIVPVTVKREKYTYTEPITNKLFAITKSSLTAYMKGIFKEQDTVSIEKKQSQSSNVVYHIVGKNNYIAKVFNQSQSVSGKRQVYIYKYISQKTKIPAPNVLFYDNTRAFFNRDMLVQDYISGVTLLSCLSVHPEKVHTVHKNLIEVLSQIHGIKISDVSSFWYLHGYHEMVKERFYLFMKDEIEKTIKILSRISLPSYLQYTIYEHTARLLLYIQKLSTVVPIHGDLSPDNIIISHEKSKCKISRILDFERAQIGDRVWDFVYYYGYVERINKKTAASWKKLIFNYLSPDEKKAFCWYRSLFHAWSIRDGVEYAEDSSRKELARKSLAILEKSIPPF